MKVIGMVHLKTLLGYPQHSEMKEVIEQAIKESSLLEKGGVDAILIENTQDDPHQKEVSPETTAAYTLTAIKIKETVKIPIGICVLWNDYKAALAIAKVTGADFVRIPVFTEAVVTAVGTIEGNPYDVISYRERIKANKVKIVSDVQVKHAAMLARRPLAESAKEALDCGADEIIITGRFTGDSPDLNDMKEVRKACPKATIVIGSGVTAENFKELAKYADKAIIGTYFKPEGTISPERIKNIINLRNGDSN